MGRNNLSFFTRNKIVVENYFFMTFLQICSSLIGLILYPYLIKVLGAERYGLYIYSLSIANYFSVFISFLSWMGLKEISQNKENVVVKSYTFSIITTLKSIGVLFVFICFFLLTLTVPFFKTNRVLLFLCFTQILIPEIICPLWYFQGIQKMKILTYIQLGFRLSTIPCIFLFVKSDSDLNIMALIVVASSVAGGIVSTCYLFIKEKCTFHIISVKELKNYVIKNYAFFGTETIGVFKQETITLLIGTCLGLRDVAIYDLANKILNIPKTVTAKINGAIFPKFMDNPNRNSIQKIFLFEIIIGSILTIITIMGGYWLVLLLGGKALIDAYPILIILSVAIFNSLFVGAVGNFVFIPNEKYKQIFYCQLVGFLTFVLMAVSLIYGIPSIYSIAVSIALANLAEIGYCYYRLKIDLPKYVA